MSWRRRRGAPPRLPQKPQTAKSASRRHLGLNSFTRAPCRLRFPLLRGAGVMLAALLLPSLALSWSLGVRPAGLSDRPGRAGRPLVQQSASSGGGMKDGVKIGPPPDMPSLLLNNRIVYLGMPISSQVAALRSARCRSRHASGRRASRGGGRPAPPRTCAFTDAARAHSRLAQHLPTDSQVVELIIGQLLYLQYDGDKPITMYINSPGEPSRALSSRKRAARQPAYPHHLPIPPAHTTHPTTHPHFSHAPFAHPPHRSFAPTTLPPARADLD